MAFLAFVDLMAGVADRITNDIDHIANPAVNDLAMRRETREDAKATQRDGLQPKRCRRQTKNEGRLCSLALL